MADYITGTIQVAIHRMITAPLHALTISWPEAIALALGLAIAISGQWRAKRWPSVALCVVLFWLLARRLAGH
ncbi:MAG TPA: hypothetical protein VNT30_18555 [Stellaceae bacterium]|nr:hypothetical protein [Stellaceae bacterium]